MRKMKGTARRIRLVEQHRFCHDGGSGYTLDLLDAVADGVRAEQGAAVREERGSAVACKWKSNRDGLID